MRFHRHLSHAVGLAVIAFGVRQSKAVVTADTLLDVGQLIGADTFYSHGFFGTQAVVANIEAGVVWDQQLLTTQDTVEFSDPSITPQVDLHATAVGSVINGSILYQPFEGIAFGATLWSGAIATSWSADPTNPGGYSGNFNISGPSFSTPYLEAMVTGVPQAGGGTADVINSSWSDSDAPDGNAYLAVTLDALVNESGKTLVLAAGNGGPSTDTVDSPASGTNAIVVGALQSDLSDPPYSTAADFSSRSPSDFFIPADPAGDSGTELTGVRARIDITAPGTDLVLAYYGGTSGGGAFGYGTADPANDLLAYPFDGTSFAAPIVASGAALVVDAGKTLFPGDPHAIDGRIIKAILMNSADKPVGWNNGQVLQNGVVTTSQALDYTYGSGVLDLNQAYSQYTQGTTDTPSLNGGSVQATGWAFGQITHQPGATATVDYNITTPLKAGTGLAVTLDWFSDEKATPDADYADNGLDASYGSFDNLDLSVYLMSSGGPQLVGESDSLYDSVQELDFALPSDGMYEIVVSETNYVWNFVGDTTTDFGLAWYVPEPTSGAILLLGGWTLLRRRRPS
jgi:Subtilase family